MPSQLHTSESMPFIGEAEDACTPTELPVSLWVARVSTCDEQMLAECRALMSVEELQRNSRYRFERDQHRDQVSRALLRSTLSRFVARPSHSLEFSIGQHGKPRLLDAPDNLSFNLSHAGDFVVLAVSLCGAIGVDIEHMERSNDIQRIAHHYFRESEIDYILMNTDGSNQDSHERFYTLWTLKESYMKARGEGVSLGLDKFGFALHHDQRIVEIDMASELNDDPRAWQFAAWQFTEQYRLAVALKHEQWHPIHIIDSKPNGEFQRKFSLLQPIGSIAYE